jgi:hypothetical protein
MSSRTKRQSRPPVTPPTSESSPATNRPLRRKRPSQGVASPPQPRVSNPVMQIYAASISYFSALEAIEGSLRVVLPRLNEAASLAKKESLEIAGSLPGLAQKARRSKGSNARDATLTLLERVQALMASTLKISRAEAMYRRQAVISMVCALDELTAEALRVVFASREDLLLAQVSTTPAIAVLRSTSIDELRADLVTSAVEGLLRKSHSDQVEFFDDSLKLGIRENFPRWNEFLEITQRRHLFVHTGGKVSRSYLRVTPPASRSADCKLGDQLSADDAYIASSANCLFEFALRLTQAVMRRLGAKDLQFIDLTLNQQGLDAILAGNPARAEHVFRFAHALPSKLVSDESSRCLFRINLALSLKRQGKAADVKAVINEADWSHVDKRYSIALAALADDFERVDRLARDYPTAFSSHEFLKLPIFDEFRASPMFRALYRRLFRREPASDLLAESNIVPGISRESA